MKLLLLWLAVLVAALFASLWIRTLARRRHDEAAWPFSAQTPLSHAERILFYRLAETLPDLVVLAQVPLSRFLRVRMGRTWRDWHERISRDSIDFLLCDRDFAIIAAVELDDRSREWQHERTHAPVAGRFRSDATKNRALAAAGIPLVRWRATALPDTATIRAVVDQIRRDRFGDVGAVAPTHVEASVNTSRIDASNDPTMFHEETRQ